MADSLGEFKGFRQGELEDMLTRVQSLEDFNGLPARVKQLVGEGALRLKRIDEEGLQVENSDKERLNGSTQSSENVNDTVRRIVADEIREIDKTHRFNFQGSWLDVSLNKLVVFAKTSDENEAESAGNALGELPKNYINRLERAGEHYWSVISGTYPEEERVDMTKYLKSDRPDAIASMRKTYTGDFLNIVTGISEAKRDL